MRLPYIVVVLALLLQCPIALLAQTARFGASDVEAIDQLFDRYNRAVSSKDYATLRNYLQSPFLRFPAGVEVRQTMDDVLSFYRNLREPLDAQQYDHSQLAQRRITALAPDRALVNGTYRRYRKDGSVLLEASAVYLVSKSSGAWKICGVFGQDLDEFGKVY